MSTSARRQPALVLLTAATLATGALSVALVTAPPAAARVTAAAMAAEGRAHPPVRISVLPPVDQPGEAATSMYDAHSVVLVRYKSRLDARPVRLQRLVDGAWRTVATRSMRRDEARFPVAANPDAVYRAVLPPHKGRPAKRSGTASDPWGGPEFADEFDAPTLSGIWEHRIQFYNPWGGRACSKGSPDAVSVESGVLRLSSMQDPDMHRPCTVQDADGRTIGRYPYRLNGHISTQQSADFMYGVAAARMRFPRSLGQHASFWLQPRGLLNTGTTPWGAEIDVVEWYGARKGRQRMASAVHEPMPDGSKRQIGGTIPNPRRFLSTRSDTWWHRFHVFSVEWTPRAYVFRIDGHRVWRTTQGVAHVPEFLILSMLSSDFELPQVGDDPTPRTAEVDWVAFWQA